MEMSRKTGKNKPKTPEAANWSIRPVYKATNPELNFELK